MNVGEEAGWIEPYRNTFYRRVTVGYQRHYVHRVVWEMHNGPIPPGMTIDHIDGNGLNNRLENLRVVPMAENTRNARRPVTNTSGVSGVSWSSNAGKWRAYTKRPSGAQQHIGYFDNIEDAEVAVRAARAALGFHENHGSVRG